MNKTIKNILFIIISVLLLFLIIDRIETTSNAYQGNQLNSETYVRCSLCLFVSLSFSILLFTRNKIDKVSRLFLVFTIYSYIVLILHSFFHGISGMVYISFLLPPLFYFYFLFLLPNISHRLLKIIIPVLFFAISYFGYINQQNILILVSSELASNSSYYALAFMPFMLLKRNWFINTMALLLVLVLVIFSIKRAGLIALLFGALTYYLFLWRIKNKKSNNLFILSFSIISILLMLFVSFQMDSLLGNVMGDKIKNVAYDGGSDRDIIYKAVFASIVDSGVLHLLFGHGWDSLMQSKIVGYSAHNDYLQLIYDLGLISFFLYMTFIIHLIKDCVILVRSHSTFAPAFACSIVMFFVLSMLSHVLLYSYFFILFTMFWGFVEYKKNNYENRSVSLSFRK